MENVIDGKLISLSKMGASLKSVKSNFDELQTPLLSETNDENSFEDITGELDGLLTRLETVNCSMSNWIERHSPSVATHHTLQRHGEILKDYRQEYNLTKNNIAGQMKRRDLLGSNRNPKTLDFTADHRMNLLLKESEHARNSERLIDDQINIAIEARDSLVHQRHAFKAIQTKLNDIANRFPIINNLTQKINFRKRRDAIIVAFFIGLCLTFLLWWTIS